MPSQYKENYLYYAGNKEVKMITFRGVNKRDTDMKFREFLIDFNTNRHETPLFKTFIEEKYKPTFLPKLAPTTQQNYKNYLDRYLIPYLGDMEIGKITVEDIQKLFDTLAKPDPERNRKALVEKTIDRISGLGRRVFRIAKEMKIIDDTPFKMALLSIDAAESGHHKALPDAEVDRIKKEIPSLTDPRQRLYMGLLAFTGLRVVVYPDRVHAVVRDKTKTKCSTRDFILPDALIEILEPLKKDSGFVIHGRDPEAPISYATLRRTYRGAFQALGIHGNTTTTTGAPPSEPS